MSHASARTPRKVVITIEDTDLDTNAIDVTLDFTPALEVDESESAATHFALAVLQLLKRRSKGYSGREFDDDEEEA